MPAHWIPAFAGMTSGSSLELAGKAAEMHTGEVRRGPDGRATLGYANCAAAWVRQRSVVSQSRHASVIDTP